MNDDLEGMCMGTVIVKFKVLSCCLPGNIEVNYENPYSGLLILRLRPT